MPARSIPFNCLYIQKVFYKDALVLLVNFHPHTYSGAPENSNVIWPAPLHSMTNCMELTMATTIPFSNRKRFPVLFKIVHGTCRSCPALPTPLTTIKPGLLLVKECSACYQVIVEPWARSAFCWYLSAVVIKCTGGTSIVFASLILEFTYL